MDSYSEKLIGLRKIKQIADKHMKNIVNIVMDEITKEEANISRRNILMKRKKLIGK